jgi:hypothetical protein
MLIEQFQDAVDDRVLGLDVQVWLREGSLRNTGTGILAAGTVCPVGSCSSY